MQRPDVLVLGAGGTIGAAWMGGVLAGIAAETGIDFRTVEHVIGTSAGSIVAADLLAGVEPRTLRADEREPGPGPGPGEDAGEDPLDEAQTIVDAAGAARRNGRVRGRAGRLGGTLAATAGASLAPLALSVSRPGGALVRAAVLARVQGEPWRSLDDLRARIAGHGLRFDGRLRVVCVDRARGRRVVFGAPSAPAAGVAEAVQASCSIPGAFSPVRIGEDEYVDGAVWSPTNMDAAPAGHDTYVLCLAPMAGPLGSRERHPAARAATTAAIRLETLALRRRGAVVQVVAPEPADPSLHARVAGFRQGRALAHGA